MRYNQPFPDSFEDPNMRKDSIKLSGNTNLGSGDQLILGKVDTLYLGSQSPSLLELAEQFFLALELALKNFEDVANLILLPSYRGKIEPKETLAGANSVLERLRRALDPGVTISSEIAQTEPVSITSLTVEEFLKDNNHVILLGKPGAGKSSTLRRLFRYYKQNFLQDPDSNPIPIYLELNLWKDSGQNFNDFLEQQIRKYSPFLATQLPNLISENKLILLLDALDELPNPKLNYPSLGRNEAIDPRIQAIEKLAVTYHQLKCLVSCREKEFSGRPYWRDLHTLSLNTVQVKAFIEAYYELLPNAAELVNSFMTDFETNTHLQELFIQPFYLVRLLSYFLEEKQIPKNPAKLLKFSVSEALLRELERANHHGKDEKQSNDEVERLKILLSHLAFNMLEASQRGEIEKSQVDAWLWDVPSISHSVDSSNDNKPSASSSKQLEMDSLLKLAEDANLLSITNQMVRFYHPLLQDYFAVSFLQSQSLNPDWLERCSYPTFKEVWKFWNELDTKLFPNLKFLLQFKSADVRKNAVLALGYINNGEAITLLIECLQDENWKVQAGAIYAISKAKNNTILSALINILSDEDKRVNYYASSALLNQGNLAFEPLFTIANNELYSNILRSHAINLLGMLGDNRANSLLYNLLTHQEPMLRNSAANALGKLKPSLAVKLLECLLKDSSPEVRASAAFALGEIGDSRASKGLEELLNGEVNVECRQKFSEAIKKIDLVRSLEKK